jgi:hypothetical protein
MNRKDLANEIRGAGNGLRYADGPVFAISLIGDDQSPKCPINKLTTSDWKIIRTASTCSTCEAVASKKDIELCEEWADCYQSFARLIWPCINHAEWCPAEPYIPVHKAASKRFEKIKAKFDAKRRAWAEKKAKMTPAELKAHRRKQRKAREDRALARLAEAYKASKQAFEEQDRQAARKRKAKKAKAAVKNAKKKPAKKKPAGKKPTKRKRR